MTGRRGNRSGTYDGVVVGIIVSDVLNLHDRDLHVKKKSRRLEP